MVISMGIPWGVDREIIWFMESWLTFLLHQDFTLPNCNKNCKIMDNYGGFTTYLVSNMCCVDDIGLARTSRSGHFACQLSKVCRFFFWALAIFFLVHVETERSFQSLFILAIWLRNGVDHGRPVYPPGWPSRVGENELPNHWILGVFPRSSDQINSEMAVDPQQDPYKLYWLVVEPYPSEKYEFVRLDHHPNYWGK